MYVVFFKVRMAIFGWVNCTVFQNWINSTGELWYFTTDDGLCFPTDFNINGNFRDDFGQPFILEGYQGVNYFKSFTDNYQYQKSLFCICQSVVYLLKGCYQLRIIQPLKRVISETDSRRFLRPQPIGFYYLRYSGINYTRPKKKMNLPIIGRYKGSWNYVGKKKGCNPIPNLDCGKLYF